MDNKNGQNFSDELSLVFNFIKEKLITDNPNDQITTEYFMLSILENKNCDAYKVIQVCTKEENLEMLHKFYLNYVHENSKTIVRPSRKLKNDETLENIINNSIKEQEKFKDINLNTEHVLLSILSNEPKNKKVLETSGINYETFNNEVTKFREDRKDVLTQKTKNIKQNKIKTPILEKNSRNLNSMSNDKKIDRLYGRRNEIKLLSNILCKRNNNCALLVGEKGCGKTALVSGIADLIQKNEIDGFFANKTIFSLDLCSLAAGAQMRGMIENTIKMIFKELEQNKDVILFIDDAHKFLSANLGNADISDAIENVISTSRVAIIAATNTSDIKYIQKNTKILDERFTRIDLKNLDEAQTFDLLKQNKIYWEKHHNVKYTDETIKESIKLAKKYISDRTLPSSAIDILDQAGAEERNSFKTENIEFDFLKAELNKASGYRKFYQNSGESTQVKYYEKIEKEIEAKMLEMEADDSKAEKVVIDVKSVKAAASTLSKIELTKINESEHDMLVNLSDNLKNVVIGQDSACDSLSNAIRKYRLGISDSKRPLSFLFIGQSGVGKTFIAKKLSQLVFGSEDDMIRLDMSEYSESHSVSKLIGAPPGYVGFEDGGKLIELVKNKKRCVLLLDEIEKAHKNVYNIFLQLLDDGRLTNSFGEVVSFKDVIIILTSNVGTNLAGQFSTGSGFIANNGNGETIIKKELKKQFPPEFLNRLNDILFFNNLSDNNLLKIIHNEVGKMTQRLSDNGINVEVSLDIMQVLLDGCKKEHGMGARPILRVIERLLEDEICNCILEHNTSNLGIDLEDDKIKITPIL